MYFVVFNQLLCVCRSGIALSELEAALDDFFTQVSQHGPNTAWTNPYLTVWSTEADINELLISLELEKENVSVHSHFMNTTNVIDVHA